MTQRSPVIHIITGLEDGGAEAVLFRLVVRDNEHRHLVVSLGNLGKYGPLLREKGIAVHALDMPRGRLTVSGVKRLMTLLRAERPQSVQTWMYHANLVGGIAAKLAGVGKVFWGIHHTTLVAGTIGKSTRFVNRLCALLSSRVPLRIIACAQKARDVHVDCGYDPGKFVVVPNGYDVSVFRPDAQARARLRAELDIPVDASVIGLVGRWDPLKDHRNLISAFERLRENSPALHLVLVGTGCDNDNVLLRQYLMGTNLTNGVHALGRRVDIPAIMNAVDVHVLSSRTEAFPNVVAEAMACGTPCVVTDVGDAALIVGDTGWVVPPRDSDALAQAIGVALREREDAEKWTERKKAARQRIVDEYSIETMVARYQAVWASE